MYKLVVITQIIINLFEIIAAVVGTIFLIKYRANYLFRYFVIFLWFTVFIEIVFGWLPTCIHYLDFFSGLKNTIFVKNTWIYNVYDIISYSFYCFFFISLFDNIKLKKMSKYLIMIYIIGSILNLFFPEFSFENNSYANFIIGTLILILVISYYY